MLLGYNTNGFAHHRLEDALDILADLGYQSVAITLDYHALNPYDPDLPSQIARVRSILQKRHLGCIIETGARFLLDTRCKHQPTLLSPTPEERGWRLDFLRRAVEVAKSLDSSLVSLWSGSVRDSSTPEPVLWDWLAAGCRELADFATERGVRLAFEPEPGMFIDTMTRFAELQRRVNHPAFGLTLDVGHVHCLADGTIPERIREWPNLLWNIHVEDMRQGVHDHLPLGEGEIAFAPVFQALQEIGYKGGLHAELSRHSHDAVNTATRTIQTLRQLLLPMSEARLD